jgi:hypothetical protein
LAASNEWIKSVETPNVNPRKSLRELALSLTLAVHSLVSEDFTLRTNLLTEMV